MATVTKIPASRKTRPARRTDAPVVSLSDLRTEVEANRQAKESAEALLRPMKTLIALIESGNFEPVTASMYALQIKLSAGEMIDKVRIATTLREARLDKEKSARLSA